MKQQEKNDAVANWFDEDAISPQLHQLYRINDSKGDRWYYTCDLDDIENTIQYYMSCTTIIDKVLPLDPFLLKWMIDTFPKFEDKQTYLNEKAEYGTFSHICIERLNINGYITQPEVEEIAQAFINAERTSWVNDVKNDLYCYDRFMKEHNVKPLAVEYMVKDDTLKVGTTIDLLCEMEYKGERIKAIVDYKSNRSGNFYDSHRAQLTVHKKIIEEQLGIEGLRIFNVSPVEIKSNTRTYYHLKEQTPKPSIFKYIELFWLDNPDTPDVREKVIVGDFGLGNYPELKVKTTLELIQERHAPDIEPLPEKAITNEEPEDLFGSMAEPPVRVLTDRDDTYQSILQRAISNQSVGVV